MKSNKSLKIALWANSSFSATSALGIFIFPEALMHLLGLPSFLALYIVAYGLLIFVLFVAYVAVKKQNQTRWVRFIVIQDLLWVLASILILVLNPWQFPVSGLVLIAFVASVVGFFAWVQFKNS